MDSACPIILYHLFFVSPSRRKWNYTYDKYLQVTSTGSYRSSKNDQIKQCSIYHVQWRNANKGQFIWLLNYWILVNPRFPSPLQESLLESWNQDPKANKLLKHMNPRPTPMLMWSVYDSMVILLDQQNRDSRIQLILIWSLIEMDSYGQAVERCVHANMPSQCHRTRDNKTTKWRGGGESTGEFIDFSPQRFPWALC